MIIVRIVFFLSEGLFFLFMDLSLYHIKLLLLQSYLSDDLKFLIESSLLLPLEIELGFQEVRVLLKL